MNNLFILFKASFRYSAVLIILCFIWSCNTINNVFSDNVTVIKNINSNITVQGQMFLDTVIGSKNIFVKNDYFVVFMNSRFSPYLFQIYDKFGSKLGCFGTKGRADNEFINNFFTGQYYINDLHQLVIWVSDDTSGEIKALNINESLAGNSAILERSIPINTMASENFILNDSILVYIINTKNNVNMIRQNYLTGQEISSLQLYKYDVEKKASLIYNGRWTIAKDENQLINAMTAINQINICNIYGTNRRSIAIGNKPHMDTEVLDKITGLPKSFYYDQVIYESGRIYALFANTTYQDIGSPKNKSVVQIFDLDLNPLSQINLDKAIFQITIDLESKTIYGLDYEDVIWKFNCKRAFE